jgi:hypothetical protein
LSGRILPVRCVSARPTPSSSGRTVPRETLSGSGRRENQPWSARRAVSRLAVKCSDPMMSCNQQEWCFAAGEKRCRGQSLVARAPAPFRLFVMRERGREMSHLSRALSTRPTDDGGRRAGWRGRLDRYAPVAALRSGFESARAVPPRSWNRARRACLGRSPSTTHLPSLAGAIAARPRPCCGGRRPCCRAERRACHGWQGSRTACARNRCWPLHCGSSSSAIVG